MFDLVNRFAGPCLLVGLLTSCFGHAATAQQGPIEPTWIYSTPITWERLGGAPRDVKTRYAGATTVILYPEGQYVEITANLYREGTAAASIPGNDGLLIRTGTWVRTDDRMIRIHSHEALEDKLLRRMKCDSGGKNCNPIERPIPGPFTTETCALEGASTTHLAQTIHCKRLIVTAAKIPLDLGSVQARASEGFHAAPLQ